MFGDFNIPLSMINRSSREKINMDMEERNNTINQQDITVVYKIFTQQ